MVRYFIVVPANRIEAQQVMRLCEISLHKVKPCHVFKSGPAEVSVIGGEHERGTHACMPPLVRGGRGISPEICFDLWLPLCAF